MYIYYCDKCKAFESFVGVDEEWKCKECGNDLLSLGVTIDEWNALSEDQMLTTINYAKEEQEKKNSKYDYSNVKDDIEKVKPNVRVNLMDCPKCGKMISPMSVDCPHCDFHFVNNPAAVRERGKKRRQGVISTIIGVILALIGMIYELLMVIIGIVPAINTILNGDKNGMYYVVFLGGAIVAAAGITMVVFGIMRIVKNKKVISTEVIEPEFVEGVSEVLKA